MTVRAEYTQQIAKLVQSGIWTQLATHLLCVAVYHGEVRVLNLLDDGDNLHERLAVAFDVQRRPCEVCGWHLVENVGEKSPYVKSRRERYILIAWSDDIRFRIRNVETKCPNDA